MLLIPSKLDFTKLKAEADRLDFWTDDSGVKMAMKPATMPNLPDELAKALAEIMSHTMKVPKYVMLNRLPPGIEVPVHTDAVPGNPKRWHLVIQTNPNAFFWSVSEGTIHMSLGWWGPVPYHENHSILNHGDTERIHFVVDLE